MNNDSYQVKRWKGRFGITYTDRNTYTVRELDKLCKKDYGVTRTALNNLFIGKLNRNVRILEVGSNNGNQLLLLKKMGFKNLYGIEVNSYAVEFSKRRCKGINIIEGSAFDIPFKDKYFDLVFTSGVLIHIHPKDIKKAMKEICRCSSKYIWGFEYYADRYDKIIYRGHENLLWKTNFKDIYLNLFNRLMPVKEKKLKYLYNENVDMMFLLKKQGIRR